MVHAVADKGAACGWVAAGVDLDAWYQEQGFTDGLPIVPPTLERVAAMVNALGGVPDHVEARVPPRWGNLTRKVLAVNMVMAGCLPEFSAVVRAALLALCDAHFNLIGVQATTHVAAPLIIVNGPERMRIGMNAGGNLFGPGNRANATIGRPSAWCCSTSAAAGQGSSTKAPSAIRASTATPSPRTKRSARGLPTTWSRATRRKTLPYSPSPPRRPTASPTTSPTTLMASSTAWSPPCPLLPTTTRSAAAIAR